MVGKDTMELAFGKYISAEKARQLGVFDACEGLQRNDQGAIDALAPIDIPKVIAGDGEDKTSDALGITGDKDDLDSKEELEPIGERMAEEKENEGLSKHRVVMHLAKGGLHRALGVSEDEKIPEDKLNGALKSSNNHVKSMAVLAKNMKGWHHGG